MNPQFWRDKKVLVTGHTGFKGSWLSLWLQDMGASVCGYSLPPPTQPSLFEIAHVADGMSSEDGDVRDFEKLRTCVAKFQPEIIFHLAAQSLVRYSYAHPIETYTTNVIGTVNLLEAVRQSPSARAVVNVTSDKCYENRELHRGYHEGDPMGGHDPYSSSKGCAELVTAAYRDSYFGAASCAVPAVALASARAGNVIGGGDWAEDRLIPDIIRAISAGQPAAIRNPGAVRPWQHVLEPLAGYLILAERLLDGGSEFAEGWNFGPAQEDAKPVSWIADHLVQCWGGTAQWQRDGLAHPPEATLLQLDAAKARSRLAWHPQFGLREAISWTVEWYKAYSDHEDMRGFSMTQISRYLERLRDGMGKACADATSGEILT